MFRSEGEPYPAVEYQAPRLKQRLCHLFCPSFSEGKANISLIAIIQASGKTNNPARPWQKTASD
jgi:hypothetical protein